MQATRLEILERVTVLLSTLPMRTTDEGGIRAALIAYQEALASVELIDLRTVVGDILNAKPVLRKWSPSAPELAQLCRDARARREGPPEAPKIEPPEILPDDDEYARMASRATKPSESLGGRHNHNEWQEDRIADGTIKEATDG